MQVLVTGGAGYVGSHAVLALLEAGHAVTILDDLSTGHRWAVPAGVRLEVASLSDPRTTGEIVRGGRFDGVMHFAARALVEESMRRPELYYEANLVAGFNLLEAVRLAGIPRLVFSSSCSIYGVPKTVPIAEDAPRQPINPYGFTKAAFEQMLEEYRRAYGLGFAALRYFNAAGADPLGRVGEDHDPETHVLPRLLRAAREADEPFVIAGNDWPTPDGTCVRDFVHVCDLAQAHLLALDRVQPGQGEFVNLGTGTGLSVLELLRQVERVTGRAVPYRVGPRRAGDPATLVACPDRARNIWGWQPRASDPETLVATAWAWMQRHRPEQSRN